MKYKNIILVILTSFGFVSCKSAYVEPAAVSLPLNERARILGLDQYIVHGALAAGDGSVGITRIDGVKVPQPLSNIITHYDVKPGKRLLTVNLMVAGYNAAGQQKLLVDLKPGKTYQMRPRVVVIRKGVSGAWSPIAFEQGTNKVVSKNVIEQGGASDR